LNKYIFAPIIIFVLLSGCLSVQSDNSTSDKLNPIKEETGKITLQGLTFMNEKGIEINRIPGYTETQPFLDTINEIMK
jgi:uncharacterized protein YceK